MSEREFTDGLRALGMRFDHTDAQDAFREIGRRGVITGADFAAAMDVGDAGGRSSTVGTAEEFDELATRVQRILRRNEGHMRDAFRRVDTDRSGLVDFREFLGALEELRVDVSEREMSEVVSETGVNISPSVSRVEE